MFWPKVTGKIKIHFMFQTVFGKSC